MPIIEVADAIKARVKKVAKKVAAKKTAAKKTAVKKTAVKKVAAKKPGVKAKRITVTPAMEADLFVGTLNKVAEGKTAEQAVKETVKEIVAEVQAASEPKPAQPVSVYDFEDAKQRFKIEDPFRVKYVPRNEFVQSVLGNANVERPLEDVVYGTPSYTNASGMLRELAGQYRVLRDQGARLPKFGKWISSTFPSNQDLLNLTAKAGQEQGKGGLVISGDIIDILRCADGQLGSCLGAGGMFKEVPVAACEETPGIFIGYINDPTTGKMKARSWLHHVRLENGEDAVLAMRWYGQGGTHEMLANYFADRGVKLFASDYWSQHQGGGAGKMRVQYIDCFKRSLHWDLYTWENDGWTNAQLINPTNNLKKVA